MVFVYLPHEEGSILVMVLVKIEDSVEAVVK